MQPKLQFVEKNHLSVDADGEYYQLGQTSDMLYITAL